MKKPLDKRVGENSPLGLSIILEGSDLTFVQSVATETIRSLEKKQIRVMTDKDFTSNDEAVINETLNLLDITKTPLSLKSRSLLSIVAAQHRLGLIAEAKKTGIYCVLTRSWLAEVVENLQKGRGELAGQIAFDNQSIRPDVWLVLSSKKQDLYSRTAEQCGVPLLHHKRVQEAVKEVLKHITYAQEAAHPISTPMPATASAHHTEPINQHPEHKYPYLRDERLGERVLMAYTLIMDKIFDNYTEATSQLTKQLGKREVAEQITVGMLPVTMQQANFHTPKAIDLSISLPMQHGTYVQLLHASPRNELDIIEAKYFARTDYTHSQLTEGLLHMPYDQRAKLLEAFVNTSDQLEASASYSFEIVAPLDVLLKLKQQNNDFVTLQPLSPRLGYDAPKPIEQYGLTPLYEQVFDLSLELHSLLMAAGLERYSYQAVLLGHFTRARVLLPLGQIKRLVTDWQNDPYAAPLIPKLLAALADVHPLVGSLLARPSEQKPPKAAPLKRPGKDVPMQRRAHESGRRRKKSK